MAPPLLLSGRKHRTGAEKLGHYCTVCGQSDRNYRRNIFPIVGQMLSETSEIDSRLLTTVPKLLARPGMPRRPALSSAP